MLWREGCWTMVSLVVAAVAVVVCQGKAVRSPSILPKDQFRCQEEGTFPVLEHCDAYYVCSSWRGDFKRDILECDAGKVFDDETHTCLDPSLVTSRPECLPEVSSEDSNAPLNSVTVGPLLPLQTEDASPSIPPALVDFRSVYAEAETPNFTLDNGVFNALIVNNISADSFDFDYVSVNGSIILTGLADDDVAFHEDENITVSPVINNPLPGETGESDSFKTTIAGSSLMETTTAVSDVFNVTTAGSDHFEDTTAGLNHLDTTTAGLNHLDTTTAGLHENTLEIVEISKKACQSFCLIVKYVYHMISSEPMRLSGVNEGPYKRLLVAYNAALERGTSYAVMWRNGNDIKNNIKEIFFLSKQYEVEFDRKYDVNLRRRNFQSTESNQNREKELLEDIRKLEQDIESTETALASAQPPFQTVFANILRKKKMTLESKKQQLQSLDSGTGFSSLVTFLGLVGNEAQMIRNKTSESQTWLSTWLDNLSKIQMELQGHFWQLSHQAEGLKTLNAKLRIAIGNHNNRISHLRREQEILETYMRDRDVRNSANIEKIREAQNAIKRKQKEHEQRIRSFCDPDGPNSYDMKRLLTVHESFELACIMLKRTINPPDITAEVEAYQDELNRVRAENEYLLNKNQKDSEKVKSLQEEKHQLEDKVQKLRVRIRRLETEITRIQAFLSQQEEAKKAWLLAKPKMQELMEGLDRVGEIFQILHVRLGDMSRLVREGLATGKGDDTAFFQNLQDKIDQSLVEIQSQLDGSSDMVEEIKSCP